MKKTTRKPLHGNKRSHSMHATRHKQRINKTTIIKDGKKEVVSVREARTYEKAS